MLINSPMMSLVGVLWCVVMRIVSGFNAYGIIMSTWHNIVQSEEGVKYALVLNSIKWLKLLPSTVKIRTVSKEGIKYYTSNNFIVENFSLGEVYIHLSDLNEFLSNISKEEIIVLPDNFRKLSASMLLYNVITQIKKTDVGKMAKDKAKENPCRLARDRYEELLLMLK